MYIMNFGNILNMLKYKILRKYQILMILIPTERHTIE